MDTNTCQIGCTQPPPHVHVDQALATSVLTRPARLRRHVAPPTPFPDEILDEVGPDGLPVQRGYNDGFAR